jgi:DNA-binding NarL/FixJ family response regulator
MNPPISPSYFLTFQEIKIIHLIKVGLSSKEIANQLMISESTVKSHRKNISSVILP